MATYYWVGGSGTWDNSSTTNWASSSGGAGGAGVPTNADDAVFDSNSGTAATVTVAATAVSLNTTIDKSDINLSLSGSPTLCTTTGTLTLTSGTITLNNNTLSTGRFSSSNSNTRSIAFGSGSIALTSTTAAALVLAMATATNFTWTGTGGFTRNQAATATVAFGSVAGGTVSNAPNLTVNAGASALTIQQLTFGSYFNNLVFTGSTSTVTGGYNACGDLTLASGGLYTSLSPTFLDSGTITSNGRTLAATAINAPGGTVTLGSALNVGATTFTVTSGTFTTSNFNVTAGALSSSNSNTRTITLGSSTVSLSAGTAVNFATSTNLTFNANTSTITVNTATPIFQGGGQTFNTVTILDGTGGASAVTISGENTFATLTINGNQAANGIKNVIISANQTISTTLTFSNTTAVRRLFVRSDTLGTQRTITLNGSLATLADVDFRDIATAGSAGTWTGTRIGDCKGNSGITFTAAKTVYWNLAGTQNWSSTGWATTNTGTPAVNNFPLAQDTATFTEAGAAGTVIIDRGWNIGSIQMADGVSNRTTAFTLNTNTVAINPSIYGSVTLFSNLTLFNTGRLTFSGRTTQVITSAGVTYTQPITVASPGGTVQLADNLTSTAAASSFLTQGTLDLSSGNRTLSCLSFSSNNSNTRAISFGSGSIALTSTTAATTVLDMATATGFTWTGTGGFTRNMAATATVNFGATAGGTASNAPNLSITGGASVVTITSGSYFKDLNFTGYGATPTATTYNASGTLTLSTTVGFNFSSSSVVFVGSGTIKSNSRNILNVTVNGSGITVTLDDALSLMSNGTLTLTQGTFNAANYNVTAGNFSSSNSNTRTLTMGSGSWDISGNTGSVWDITDPTNLTLNKDTANITLSASGTPKTFAGGGQTYNNLVIGGAGTSTLTFTGSNTFGTISSTKTVAHTISFAPGTTTTVSGWTVAGSAGNVVTINSTTPGSQFTLSDAAGSVTTDFMNITDSNATGGARWTALSSINGGNNSGWLFGAYNISGDSELLFFP